MTDDLHLTAYDSGDAMPASPPRKTALALQVFRFSEWRTIRSLDDSAGTLKARRADLLDQQEAWERSGTFGDAAIRITHVDVIEPSHLQRHRSSRHV